MNSMLIRRYSAGIVHKNNDVGRVMYMRKRVLLFFFELMVLILFSSVVAAESFSDLGELIYNDKTEEITSVIFMCTVTDQTVWVFKNGGTNKYSGIKDGISIGDWMRIKLVISKNIDNGDASIKFKAAAKGDASDISDRFYLESKDMSQTHGDSFIELRDKFSYFSTMEDVFSCESEYNGSLKKYSNGKWGGVFTKSLHNPAGRVMSLDCEPVEGIYDRFFEVAFEELSDKMRNAK